MKHPVPIASLFDYALNNGASLYDKESFRPRLRVRAANGRLINDPPVEPLDYEIIDEPMLAKRLDDGIFEPYRPRRLRFPGAKPHPTPLIESTTLASVAPPIPTARPLLPRSLIDEGILSEAQLEAIVLAMQAHERHIEITDTDPEQAYQVIQQRVRGGFLLGDATGAGKGRINQGIILANRLAGRHKAIYISENADLIADAIRDWKDLGGDERDIFLQSSIPAEQPILRQCGTLFTTYATLRRKTKNSTARWEQAAQWLRDCPDAVIICDEAHNLTNAVPNHTATEGWQRHASLQGIALLNLQRTLPDARLVYCSATALTKLEALAFAPRLGLWGPKRPFPTRNACIDALETSGTAGMEALCLDLKALGLYVSRSLSLAGVTYERLVHELTREQVDLIQSLNKVWQAIQSGMHDALVATSVIAPESIGTPRVAYAPVRAAIARAELESAKLRFYQIALMSLKMPSVIAHMRERLAQGECCIVQLFNTNATSQERALQQFERDHPDHDLSEELPLDLDLSPRSVLTDYLLQAFPIYQCHRVQNTSEIVLDPKTGEPVVNPQALAIRDRLIQDIEHLIAPENPLDILEREFGDDLAELSGRRRRPITRLNERGNIERILQTRPTTANHEAPLDFMNDKKHILVFSEMTGGTGRSFHADPRWPNQRKRNHYILQMSWKTDKCYQGMGRSHRANQTVAPHYVLCTTNMPGEMRFASNLAKGCATLGALCRGQRDACNTGLFASTDNLETIYGAQALHDLLAGIAKREIDIPLEDFYLQTGIDPTAALKTRTQARKFGGVPTVGKFLNRLLSVDIDLNGGLQGRIWEAFVERVQSRIDHAIAKHCFDAGIETIRPLRLIIKKTELLNRDPATGAESYLLTLEREDPLVARPFEAALAALQRSREDYGPGSGSFVEHIQTSKVALHLWRFNEIRVLTPFSEYIRTTSEQTMTISQTDAKQLWNREIAAAPATTTRSFYVVTGALLPIWSLLPEHTPRIYRMLTSDTHTRILGRVIPATEVNSLKRRIQQRAALLAS
jgi:hypothetical protein